MTQYIQNYIHTYILYVHTYNKNIKPYFVLLYYYSALQGHRLALLLEDSKEIQILGINYKGDNDFYHIHFSLSTFGQQHLTFSGFVSSMGFMGAYASNSTR